MAFGKEVGRLVIDSSIDNNNNNNIGSYTASIHRILELGSAWTLTCDLTIFGVFRDDPTDEKDLIY